MSTVLSMSFAKAFLTRRCDSLDDGFEFQLSCMMLETENSVSLQIQRSGIVGRMFWNNEQWINSWKCYCHIILSWRQTWM